MPERQRLLWRISTHPDLRGEGGLRAPARWHSKGRAVVYTAEAPTGAWGELALNVIESVKIEQSFIGRIFNVGDITIVGMGASPEFIHSVKRPVKFKEEFYKQKGRYMLAPNTPANPA